VSGRPGIQITVKVPAEGGVPPNRYESVVSAHVRAYWPPEATDAEIAKALALAFAEAREAVREVRYR